jgi:hypothetical protein
LLGDADPAVRRASLESLRLLKAAQAVPMAVAALGDRDLELTALQFLAELAGPDQAAAVAEFAQRSPSADGLSAAVRALSAWRNRPGLTAAQQSMLDRAVADIHGAAGIPVRWRIRTSPSQDASAVVEQFGVFGNDAGAPGWRTEFATGTEARLTLSSKDVAKTEHWFAYTDFAVAEPAAVEFLASSSGTLRVWLNGKELYRRETARKLQIDSDRFAGALVKGLNRLLVQVEPAGAAGEFHLHFRRKSSTADHERLALAALSRGGNPERGRKLFLDTEKSLCLKCHRLGEQGERIGPELTGIGSRFSRIYIVESILQPSRTIAPSYGTLLVTLTNGKLLSGVKIAESETTLTLADG